jgi:hypothetical protein
MTIGPAESPQRTILIVAGVVVLLLTAGAWYVSATSKKSLLAQFTKQNFFADSTQPNNSTVAADSANQLPLTLQETADSPQSNGTRTYTIILPPTTQPLVGVEIALSVRNAASIKSQSRSFAVSNTLAETGWKSMVNTTTSSSQSFSSNSNSNDESTSTSETTIGLSFLNLDTEGWTSTELLELGTITITPADPAIEPQFTVVQEKSSAFTKDGQTLSLNLILTPKVTE